MPIDVVACSPTLGAEIRGVDLSQPLDGATVGVLKDAWAAHLVLLFRGQDLSDADLVRFSSHFGECDHAPPNEAANSTSDGYVPDLPEVTVISNVVVDGVSIGSLGAGECAWHTDMSYMPEPAAASALYAVEVPEEAGDTGFLNMYRAYETLAEDLKDQLVGKMAIHDATYTSAGTLRKGVEEVSDVREEAGARSASV